MKLPSFTVNCMVCCAGLRICVEMYDMKDCRFHWSAFNLKSSFEGVCFPKVNFFSYVRGLLAKTYNFQEWNMQCSIREMLSAGGLSSRPFFTVRRFNSDTLRHVMFSTLFTKWRIRKVNVKFPYYFVNISITNLQHSLKPISVCG